MPNPAEVLAWAQVVSTLVQLGIVTGTQVAAVVKLLLEATGKSDVEYAPEDAALSAETHSILAAIIATAQAQSGAPPA
ncbi:MAG: hypothetical protein PHR30_16595 [Gallionellaceae bacterium]|nr:hypothetical protein [Gallionellaceae bacterium]